MFAQNPVHTNIHDILNTVSKKLDCPRCLPTGEWLNKLQQIHATEYYSVIKKTNFDAFNNMSDQRITSEWKIPSQRQMVWVPIYMTFSKWQIYGNDEQFGSCQSLVTIKNGSRRHCCSYRRVIFQSFGDGTILLSMMVDTQNLDEINL